jgi:hypothetical protein
MLYISISIEIHTFSIIFYKTKPPIVGGFVEGLF